MKIIPYSRQYIDAKDIRSVTTALKKDLITTGNEISKFENNFCKYCNSKFALTCSNGTAALMLAYLALKVNKNTIIVMPSINFVASANMAKILNAKIYLTDVDPLSGQMTKDHLLECIKKNNLNRIDIVILMHNGGLPVKIKSFLKLKKKYRFKIIEDACHALGAKYSNNIRVGSCKYSDISIFSFHPLKSITTGEGGMITTNKRSIYENLKKFRNHGITKKMVNFKNYNWGYNINDAGFNFRLTDFQCALGSSQLKKLNKFITYRKKIAYIYQKKLVANNEKIISNNSKINFNSAFHLFIIHLNLKKIKYNKNEIIQKLYRKKIITQVHYKPIFKFRAFNYLFKKNNFNNAIKYYSSTLSIPIFYGLSAKKVNYIIKEIKKIL